MNIIESQMTITKLEAPEGQYLTRTDLAEGDTPIFVTVAFLGQSDSEHNWRLASPAEKEAAEAEAEQSNLPLSNELR